MPLVISARAASGRVARDVDVVRLAALLSVQERGGNASVPARALWQEFASARDMLVAVAFDQTAWLAGDAGA